MGLLPIIYLIKPRNANDHQNVRPYLIEHPLMSQLREAGLDSFEYTALWCRFCYQFTDPDLVSELRPFRILTFIQKIGIWVANHLSIPKSDLIPVSANSLLKPILNWWSDSFRNKQAIFENTFAEINRIREILEPIQRYSGNDWDFAPARDQLKKALQAFETLDKSLVEFAKITKKEEVQLIFWLFFLRSIYALTRSAIQVRLGGKLSKLAVYPSWCAGLYFDKELQVIENTAKWYRSLKVDTPEPRNLLSFDYFPPSSFKNFGIIKYLKVRKFEDYQGDEDFLSFKAERFKGFSTAYEPIPLYFELADLLELDVDRDKNEPAAFARAVENEERFVLLYEHFLHKEIPSAAVDKSLHKEAALISSIDGYLTDRPPGSFFDRFEDKLDRHFMGFIFAYSLINISIYFYKLFINQNNLDFWSYPYNLATVVLYILFHKLGTLWFSYSRIYALIFTMVAFLIGFTLPAS